MGKDSKGRSTDETVKYNTIRYYKILDYKTKICIGIPFQPYHHSYLTTDLPTGFLLRHTIYYIPPCSATPKHFASAASNMMSGAYAHIISIILYDILRP